MYHIVPMAGEHLEQVEAIERLCFPDPWSRRLLEELLGHAGGKAVVQVGGQGKQELNLSKDQEFWVGDPEIGRNLVREEDGTVMVAQADCPDKICVHTGPISQEGEVIACLPHGVIIYIPWEEG